MAIANTAHGGTATNTTSSATSLAITVTAVAGEFIFVTISTLAASATTAVTDNIGNKYYLLNDQIGASGRISCWFCPKSSGTVATVTATHAASRASGSVSTYTGILGVGHSQEATNAANNNTITMSPAIGSGNAMIAGMGDAVGTQTWTAVTGTLRNNIAGGGSTTPGATNMDTLVSGGSTLAASLSTSVSGEAIAIEVFGAVLPLATDLSNLEQLDVPPFMWELSPMEMFYSGEDQDSWGLNTNNLGAGGTQMMGFRGHVIYPSAMADDYLQPGQPTIVVTTVQEAFDQDEGLNLDWRFTEDGTSELEAITEDFIHEMVSLDLLYQYPASLNFILDDEPFGFQSQVVTVIKAYDLEEGIPFVDLQQQWTDDDSAQSTFFAREQYSDADEQPDINAWYGIQWTDEDKTDSTFFRLEQYADFVEDPSVRAWGQFQDVEDSSYEPAIWQNPVDEDNWENYAKGWIQYQWTDDDKTDATFFAHEQYADNIENTPQSSLYFQAVDQEQYEWGFNTPELIGEFVLDPEYEYPNFWTQRQWTDDDKTDSTFFALEQYADIDEQPDVNQWFAYQEDDVFGFNFISPTNRPLPEDAEFNPAQQQSYYFGSEDLEKYNWGWMPPMTPVNEDDAPYDSQAQMRSYFVPAIEDEMFSWGLWKYFSFDQDEVPVVTTQRLFHEEDFGFQQFVQLSFGQELEPLVLTGLVIEDDAFGFRQQIFIATDDSPEQMFSTNLVRDDVDYFGFQTPVVTVNTPFSEDDQRPIQQRVYAEDETFGYQIGFAQEAEVAPQVERRAFSIEDEMFGEIIIVAEVQAEQPILFNRIFADDEFALLPEPFAGADMQAEPPSQRVDIQDEERQIAFNIVQPFSFGDEIDHLPNPPYPITNQVEFDQHGQQPPFIISQPFAWEEDGIPPNQPWPVLDVTDYNDWITNVITVIMKIYQVSIKQVLAIMTLSAAQQAIVYELINKNKFLVALTQSSALLGVSEVEAVPSLSVESVQFIS